MKDDYNDYRVRTYISQSFEVSRELNSNLEAHELLNKGEEYVLGLYNENRLQVAWNREDGAPTLTMKS